VNELSSPSPLHLPYNTTLYHLGSNVLRPNPPSTA
jgi:hypothetical protein